VKYFIKKKELFIWVCDYSKNTGEGKLARLFTKFLSQKGYNFSLNQKKKFKSKYLSTLQGIYYCWKNYLTGNKICYLNYLPFWNFVIFALLPPKTILGPITGGSNITDLNIFNYFIRAYLFPIFYSLSEFLINVRFKNIIFSTNLLKKNLKKDTIKKCKFNFVIRSFKKKKRRKKIFDFLIYNRKHNNKFNIEYYKLINLLSSKKLKINVVGDKIKNKYINNLGYISNKQVEIYQSLSKFTIASYENIYSFFIIECLSNHVKVLVPHNYQRQLNFRKKQFIFYDAKNLKKYSLFKKLQIQ
jgi:hypothetical protein